MEQVTLLGLSVCVCVFVYSQTTGYQAAYKRYQRLQCNMGLKNNVVDFAEMSEFESEKLALSWSTLCSPTHQLVSSASRILSCI